MANKKEPLEKYSIGFNFSKPDEPYLLVGEGFGSDFRVVNTITHKELIAELYKALTKKPYTH